MALTRAMLKGMSLTDEQVSAIIDEHTATVDGLKAQRDEFKEQVDKLNNLKKELEDLKSGEDWETKYNDEHKAFESYKKQIEEKETTNNLKNAYRKLLLDNSVGEKHIDSILRVTDFSKMKLDKDGKLVDEDKMSESIKSEWSGFVTSTEVKNANVENPPQKNTGPSMTKEQIMAIKDGTDRRKAMAENAELFPQLNS